MKLEAFQQTAGRKILVYGQPKTGKTVKVGELAEKKRLWWFDFEDGIKSVFNAPSIKKEWLKNIEYFHIPDTQVMPIAARTLLKVIKGGETKICNQHGAVNCPMCLKDGKEFSTINLSTFTNDDVLVLDSVSQLAASAMNDIQHKIIMADQFDKKPEWDDYFNQGRIMDRIFSIMQQAPFNVVAISHEQMVEQEDKSKKIVPIGGTSQFSKTFAKYFDDVGYCEIVNKRHVIATSSTYKQNVMSGSRAGKVLEAGKDGGSLLELFA